MIDSSLEVPVHHLVRNVIAVYALSGARLPAPHVPLPLYQGHQLCRKGREPRLAQSNLQTHRFLGSIPKKTLVTSPTGCTDLKSYFADIRLDVEEPTVVAPPRPKKKKVELEKRMAYKYLAA